MFAELAYAITLEAIYFRWCEVARVRDKSRAAFWVRYHLVRIA